MSSYARPDLCPDCGAVLPQDPVSCPRCGLPLRDPLADELLATLRRADELLVRLRASAVPGAPAAGPGPAPASRRRRLSQATVPQLLLALGAACLLVAAVVFLAVAWSSLGVAGRTAVLLVLTLSAGGGSLLLRRHDLAAAAEAVAAVALGLVVLDVLGAAESGWVPEPGSAGSGVVLGSALAAAGLALSALHLLLARARPVVPQLVPAPALLVVAGAMAALVDDGAGGGSGAWVGGVLGSGVLVLLGARLRLPVLRVAAGAGGVLAWWVLLAVSVVDTTDDLSLRGLWAEGGATWLLVAAVLALLPLLAGDVRRHRAAVVPAVVALALVSLVVVMPALDEGADAVLVATGAVVAAWSLVALALVLGPPRLPVRARVVPVGAAVAFAAPVLGPVVAMLMSAVDALLGLGDPYSAGAGVRLDGPGTAWDPLLLVPAVLALALLALVVLALVAPREPWRRAGVTVTGLAVVVSVLASAALLDAPLAALVVPVALVAGTTVALASRSAAGFGLAVAALTALLALPSAALAAVTAGLLALALASRVVRAGEAAATEVWAALPVALVAALWALGSVVGLDVAQRGAATLVVVGVLALLVRRADVDVATALVAPWPAVAGVLAADDLSVSLSLHLTLVGALLVARALTDARRRRVAWAGGLLLAAATWVQLADIGVEAPEPYTAPSALALLVVGLLALRRTPGRGSVETLLPGLLLAVVPSLLWVLAQDPVSWRALLLGMGCLVLVLSGTRLGWQAPLLVGGVAGALVVLRELAPYAAATPQWVLLAAAGALLLVVGITWERRVRDLRVAGGYLARLR
ncbi:MAG: zinc ribbon domain-containing protein [Nocardioides marinisabuli]|uniref:zinc ribbon domain-containing protein n=1 Tax=Nocardioides marinisabuli TaxID=419476 RepID=UPI00321A468C